MMFTKEEESSEVEGLRWNEVLDINDKDDPLALKLLNFADSRGKDSEAAQAVRREKLTRRMARMILQDVEGTNIHRDIGYEQLDLESGIVKFYEVMDRHWEDFESGGQSESAKRSLQCIS